MDGGFCSSLFSLDSTNAKCPLRENVVYEWSSEWALPKSLVLVSVSAHSLLPNTNMSLASESGAFSNITSWLLFTFWAETSFLNSSSKLRLGVNVSVDGFFVSICQPCDELMTCPDERWKMNEWILNFHSHITYNQCQRIHIDIFGSSLARPFCKCSEIWTN